MLFLAGYDGLDTHHTSKQPFPCEGIDRCSYCKRRQGIIWKGYAPVLAWDATKSLWHPFVLEITESLEEELRGRDLRGEVWHLFREGKGKNNDPLTGLFAERKTGRVVIEPFDIVPVLLRLYHVSSLRLGRPNTMPAKLVLPAIAGDAPALPPGASPATEAKPDPAKVQSFRELRQQAEEAARRRAGGQTRPTGEVNGNGKDHEANGKR